MEWLDKYQVRNYKDTTQQGQGEREQESGGERKNFFPSPSMPLIKDKAGS
jgi:hypothetical protein